MTLQEFKNHISSFPEGTVFDYGISEPFSWRGRYDEVAFTIITEPTSREEILEHINTAFVKTFRGWKGGYYEYSGFTPVNFENDTSSWSDGEYVQHHIDQLLPEFDTPEFKFVKLAFTTK